MEYRYDTQLLIEGKRLDEDAISGYFCAHFPGTASWLWEMRI